MGYIHVIDGRCHEIWDDNVDDLKRKYGIGTFRRMMVRFPKLKQLMGHMLEQLVMKEAQNHLDFLGVEVTIKDINNKLYINLNTILL